MLTAGSAAPDVLLKLHNGTSHRLSDLWSSKNVVLYFYPKDFTWGCTRQACSFADHYQDIISFQASLIGISADSTESHRQFAEQHRLPFLLASDPDLAIARSYKVVTFGFRRLRVTYVVDRQGTIRGVVHHEVIVENHWKSVLNILNELEQPAKE
ncbi:MAG: peroxiredoxin [Bacteroidota bacterium]